MKHRHIYFAAAFLLLLLICTAYNLSYHYITGNPPSAEEPADHESETIRSAPANAGNPLPVYQYYLKEEQGCVCIYLDDKETLYENTSIRLSSLPDALKTEIKNGKYIRTKKELYDFLEAGDVLGDSGYEFEGLHDANHNVGKALIALEAATYL